MLIYYHIFFLSGLAFLLMVLIFNTFRVLVDGSMRDPSKSRGNPFLGVVYSVGPAMLPMKKETAYRHLPTYTCGILFHVGSFLSFFYLIVHFFQIQLIMTVKQISFFYLLLSSSCGFGILIKRITEEKMKKISCLDDYFSNIIVDAFQLITALSLIRTIFIPYSFLIAGFLLFYIPIGKMRHIIYFITTRIHLGIHFGKRGTWPPHRSSMI